MKKKKKLYKAYKKWVEEQLLKQKQEYELAKKKTEEGLNLLAQRKAEKARNMRKMREEETRRFFENQKEIQIW